MISYLSWNLFTAAQLISLLEPHLTLIVYIKDQLCLSFRAKVADFSEVILLNHGETVIVHMIFIQRTIKLLFSLLTRKNSWKLNLTKSNMQSDTIINLWPLSDKIKVTYSFLMQKNIPVVHIQILALHMNYLKGLHLDQSKQSFILMVLITSKWKKLKYSKSSSRNEITNFI